MSAAVGCSPAGTCGPESPSSQVAQKLPRPPHHVAAVLAATQTRIAPAASVTLASAVAVVAGLVDRTHVAANLRNGYPGRRSVGSSGSLVSRNRRSSSGRRRRCASAARVVRRSSLHRHRNRCRSDGSSPRRGDPGCAIPMGTASLVSRIIRLLPTR